MSYSRHHLDCSDHHIFLQIRHQSIHLHMLLSMVGFMFDRPIHEEFCKSMNIHHFKSDSHRHIIQCQSLTRPHISGRILMGFKCMRNQVQLNKNQNTHLHWVRFDHHMFLYFLSLRFHKDFMNKHLDSHNTHNLVLFNNWKNIHQSYLNSNHHITLLSPELHPRTSNDIIHWRSYDLIDKLYTLLSKLKSYKKCRLYIKRQDIYRLWW